MNLKIQLILEVILLLFPLMKCFKHSRMLKLGDDVYEEDQEVNELQEYAAKLLR